MDDEDEEETDEEIKFMDMLEEEKLASNEIDKINELSGDTSPLLKKVQNLLDKND